MASCETLNAQVQRWRVEPAAATDCWSAFAFLRRGSPETISLRVSRFFRLHSRHTSRRFSVAVAPPLARGMMWSNSASLSGTFRQHILHAGPSRRTTWSMTSRGIVLLVLRSSCVSVKDSASKKTGQMCPNTLQLSSSCETTGPVGTGGVFRPLFYAAGKSQFRSVF